MPTPKQVRYHYERIARLRWKLIYALNDAHNADVIVYTDQALSPCASHSETWRQVEMTTEKQLAEAMRTEIRGNKW